MLAPKNPTGVPLYHQLSSILRERVLAGEFAPDERIPPEAELCRVYGVSRITVRKAIDELVREQLLYTRQGRGTFVTAHKLRRRLPRLYSFTEDMREIGHSPSSSLIELSETRCDAQDAGLLQLPDDSTRVFRIVRVRRADGVPILLETTLVPAILCPGLRGRDLERGSLYATLRQDYGLALNDAEETYEASIVRAAEARLLECRRNSAVFRIRRVACLADGMPFELTRSVARGDSMKFVLHLVSNTAEMRRTVDVSGDR